MSRVDENIKYGMIEAISHLIHRDYEAIVEDFVTLEFIPPGTDLSPILPVLAKVCPWPLLCIPAFACIKSKSCWGCLSY